EQRLGTKAIHLTTVFSYPGLEVSESALVTQLGLKLVGNKDVCKVAFGTEAGIFVDLGIPTIVCGPGSMSGQGHKPDEYITIDQLKSCEMALKQSVEGLC
ncbi:MAG: M20/M25/M40 family metallo-hydrolase, partial [Paracoccaceae bacterium]